MMPEPVDPQTLGRWEQLAEAVRAELEAMGLPACRLVNGVSDGQIKNEGAVVDLDPFWDGAGGVFVKWQVPAGLTLPAVEALRGGVARMIPQSFEREPLPRSWVALLPSCWRPLDTRWVAPPRSGTDLLRSK